MSLKLEFFVKTIDVNIFQNISNNFTKSGNLKKHEYCV